MANERQGGSSTLVGQEELGLGVRGEDKGTEQEHVADLEGKCEHYISRIAELVEILDRINLIPLGVDCVMCGLGEVDVPYLPYLWACLDCKLVFCGNEGPDVEPDGHLTEHSLKHDHPLCVRLDKMSEIWCLICLVKEEVESATDFWDELEEANSCIVKKLPNYGNTCYFNSILQNLFAMDMLRGSLARLEQPVRDITREMKCIFTEACDESKDTIQPTGLLEFVRRTIQFVSGTQQDSHELFIFLLDELKSEKADFVDEIFGGEASSSIHCARCGHTSTTKEPFLDLSLAVPSTSHLIRRDKNIGLKDNVPPALEYSSLVPKFNRSFPPEDPFGMGDILTPVTSAYTEPGSDEPVPFSVANNTEVPSENVEAVSPDHSDVENTTAKFPEPLFEKGKVSSSGKLDAKIETDVDDIHTDVEAEKFPEPLFEKGKVSSSGKPDAKLETDVEDINTDVEAEFWSGDRSNASMFDEVHEVDNTDGPVSIERCLDVYIQAEELSDTRCDGCSGKLQQQQQPPSEISDFREDADKLSENNSSELPSNISHQKKGECAEINLAEGIVSLQGQTETDQLNSNEDLETKCKQVESKITKKLFINKPPHLLTIHLKRFTKTFQKVEGYIDFKELLDLAPYIRRCSAEDRQCLYRLIGVVEHLGGTLCSGHYVAYVEREKSPGCRAWYKANDTQVEEVELREVLKRESCLLQILPSWWILL